MKFIKNNPFRYLQPPAAFSGLSMRPECVCGLGSAQNPGKLTALPRHPSWWGGARPVPKNPSPLSAFGLDLPPLLNSFRRHWLPAICCFVVNKINLSKCVDDRHSCRLFRYSDVCGWCMQWRAYNLQLNRGKTKAIVLVLLSTRAGNAEYPSHHTSAGNSPRQVVHRVTLTRGSCLSAFWIHVKLLFRIVSYRRRLITWRVTSSVRVHRRWMRCGYFE